MNLFYSLPVLFMACAMTVIAQSVPSKSGIEMTQGLDRVYASLELTKDLLHLRYCSNDSLQFTVRLNFSNKGNGPVILDKRSRSASAYLISRTFENAIKRKHEFVVHIFIGHDEANSVPDESKFVVLKPGESYSLEQMIHLHDRSSMRVGHHVLQMVTSNWYYLASNVEWRGRWKDKGYLWTDPIISVPMPFTVEKKPVVVDCH